MLAIVPCPPLVTSSDTVIITGTFRHQSARVLDLYVAGEPAPIGTTANHPFWSEDRQAFVRADSLRPAETLRTLHGPRRVVRWERRSGPEPVYNIEVAGSHVYALGASGVSVHNGDGDPCPIGGRLGHDIGRDAPDQRDPERLNRGEGEAHAAEVRRQYEELTRSEQLAARKNQQQVRYRRPDGSLEVASLRQPDLSYPLGGPGGRIVHVQVVSEHSPDRMEDILAADRTSIVKISDIRSGQPIVSWWEMRDGQIQQTENPKP